MTRAYQPVAGCGESRKSGGEWEGCEATGSSTPTEELSASGGARVEYLPPYSPDFNPPIDVVVND